MDPHRFGSLDLDPDPNYGKKLDPDPLKKSQQCLPESTDYDKSCSGAQTITFCRKAESWNVLEVFYTSTDCLPSSGILYIQHKVQEFVFSIAELKLPHRVL
jgi:hypothetical protein